MSNINVFVGAKMSKQSLNTNNVMEQPFNFGGGGVVIFCYQIS
jgi:hypothetical protein